MRWFLLISLLLHGLLFLAPGQFRAGAGNAPATVRVSWKTTAEIAPGPPAPSEAPASSAPEREEKEPAPPAPEPSPQLIAPPPPEPVAETTPAAPEKKPEPPRKAARPPKKEQTQSTVAQKTPARDEKPVIQGAAPDAGKNASRGAGQAVPSEAPRGAQEQMFGQAAGPSYKSFVPPPYPERARQRRQEGFVLLRVLITAQGKADRWEVVEASNPVFVAAAEQSLRLSSFNPYTEDGQARDCWVRLPLRFSLR